MNAAAWPPRELIDDIDRSKIEQACRMTPGQRLLAGPELFDLGREFMLAGIRMQHPDADEQEIRRLARRRLDLDKALDENESAYNRFIGGLHRDAGGGGVE